jgi:hypothetical protein
MSKYVAILITLIVLMALPIIASLNATQVMPPTSPLNISPRPVHNGHPRIPVNPGQPVNPGPKSNVPTTTIQAPCPLPSAECYASFNWGGYAVTGADRSVTDVKGSWIVPKVANSAAGNGKCLHDDISWYDASFWIGIDGWSSNTVEQTGTASDCYYGTLFYYAWYEFYPANSFTVFNVNPGDRMTAEVSYSAGMFTTTITDLTSHQTFTSSPTAVPGAAENSAEWISESAAACVGSSCFILALLDLSDFGTATFSAATATINAVTGPISSFGSNVQWVEMVNLNYPATPEFPQQDTKDVPSALTAKGNGFTVKFVSAGP